MEHFLIRMEGAQQHLMDPDVVQGHVAWLRALDEAGRLVLAGPMEGGQALVVIRAESRAEAVKIAEADPFAAAGAYKSRRVLRFTRAEAANDYLLGLGRSLPSP